MPKKESFEQLLQYYLPDSNYAENKEDEDLDNFDIPMHVIDMDIASEEYISYQSSGLRNKKWQKLTKGVIEIEGVLDLHGEKVAEAFKKLLNFIQCCLENNHRCLLIIHGKGQHGKPVLKNHLNYWLRHHPYVMAFVSAQPKDGGNGAVYVLLRSNR